MTSHFTKPIRAIHFMVPAFVMLLGTMLERMTYAGGTAVPSAELKVTTPIKSSTRALQALLRMALVLARESPCA